MESEFQSIASKVNTILTSSLVFCDLNSETCAVRACHLLTARLQWGMDMPSAWFEIGETRCTLCIFHSRDCARRLHKSSVLAAPMPGGANVCFKFRAICHVFRCVCVASDQETSLNQGISQIILVFACASSSKSVFFKEFGAAMALRNHARKFSGNYFCKAVVGCNLSLWR